MKNYKFKSLTIIYDVTKVCPFNCRICCMGAENSRGKLADELTLAQKLELVDQIKELQENGIDVRVDLSGGEIFTNKAENNELIKKLSDRIGKDKVGISCSGWGIDDEQAAFLKKYSPDVEMTLDTVPFRSYCYRSDSYSKKAASAALLLKKHGVKVGMQTVVTRHLANYADAESVFAFLCANHIDCWSLLRFFPSGRGANFPEEALSDEECLGYVRMVQEIVNKSKAEYKPKVDFHYTMPGHEKYTNVCRCVRHSIGILPNGDVVACFWALDGNTGCIDPKFLLGNVKNNSLSEILDGEKARYWSECEHCCELDEIKEGKGEGEHVLLA